MLCDNSTEGIAQTLNDFLDGKSSIDAAAAKRRAAEFSTSSAVEHFEELLA